MTRNNYASIEALTERFAVPNEGCLVAWQKSFKNKLAFPMVNAPVAWEEAEYDLHAATLAAVAAIRGFREEPRVDLARAFRLWKQSTPLIQGANPLPAALIPQYYLSVGDVRKAGRFVSLLENLGTSRASVPALAVSSLMRGVALRQGGDPREAIRLFEKSRYYFDHEMGHKAGVAWTYQFEGEAWRMLSEFHLSRARFLQAMEIAQESEEFIIYLRSRFNHALTIMRLGQLDKAASEVVECLKLFKRTGDPIRVAQAELNEYYLASIMGKVKAAPCEPEGLRDRAIYYEYRGIAANLTGGEDLDVLQNHRKALALGRKLSLQNDIIGENHRWLAEFWVSRGHARYAKLHMKRARAIPPTSMEGEDLFALDRLDAEIASLEGHHDLAFEALVAHVERVREKGFSYEQFLAAHRAARIAALAGQHDLSDAWWARTQALGSEIGCGDLASKWFGEREDQVAHIAEEPSDPNELNLRDFGIVTASPVLKGHGRKLLRLAAANNPILIRGETGTGKEVFAKLVHAISHRAHKCYYTLNCGAIPRELVESELFGHEEGSFTGATKSAPGVFRKANGGTLFLDEIGEMPVAAQTRLLRVLENGEVRAVGSADVQYVDVRVVAATNVDLAAAVKERKFRKDLYYRLNSLELLLPPLRERREDIPLLAQHFLSIGQRDGKVPTHLRLSGEAIAWLSGRSWPGNARQLREAVEMAAHFAGNERDIRSEHFLSVIGDDLPVNDPSEPGSLQQEILDYERSRVLAALEEHEWNVTAAGKSLNVTRTSLAAKIRRLGIQKPQKKS